jgi:hypothetical protein
MKNALMVWAQLETVCFHEYPTVSTVTWTVSDDFAHETIMVTFGNFGPNTSRMAAIATPAHTFLYWHVKKICTIGNGSRPGNTPVVQF